MLHRCSASQAHEGKSQLCRNREERGMENLTRRSVLRGSAALAATGALARPPIANAAATTATVWWTQGFIQSEDVAFQNLAAAYEKASGNKLDYSIMPFAPLRQKEVSAITSGAVPDVMELADYFFAASNAWNDKLLDVSDIVETQKSKFFDVATQSMYLYNNETKTQLLRCSDEGIGCDISYFEI